MPQPDEALAQGTGVSYVAEGMPQNLVEVVAGLRVVERAEFRGYTCGQDALFHIPDGIASILDGTLTVPTATFGIEQIREAVTMQAGRHVHDKIVITL